MDTYSGKSLKALTVGSATIDIIATIATKDIERMTLHNNTSSFLLMESGRKVDAEAIVTYTGGGAINAAVSLGRQGFDVSTLVKVGRDINADKLLERLESENISTELVRVHDSELTAVSMLVSSHDRNTAIFTHRGANGFLTDDDVSQDCFDNIDLVYVTNLSNDSSDLFRDIVSRAKTANAFVAVNPGIVQLTTKTAPFFDSLDNVDLFVCNFQEARALVPQLVDRTGWEKHTAFESDPGDRVLDIEGFRLTLQDYAKRLHLLGVKYVGVTDGENGAYLFDGTKLIHQEVIPAKVVGTTGAGDSFVSTLAGSLVQGFDCEKAMHLAALNAASVVGFADAQTGLLTKGNLC